MLARIISGCRQVKIIRKWFSWNIIKECNVTESKWSLLSFFMLPFADEWSFIPAEALVNAQPSPLLCMQSHFQPPLSVMKWATARVCSRQRLSLFMPSSMTRVVVVKWPNTWIDFALSKREQVKHWLGGGNLPRPSFLLHSAAQRCLFQLKLECLWTRSLI